MVATKSANKPKASYAERVLGAFTHLQKEHRKHAVHTASLRAQVKKNAEAKKDKLGPNWSHWVSKAVVKLENEGILEPAASAGSVALTPNGKKAISDARRSLKTSNGASPNKNQEDVIWKQVATHGLKRSRRASSIGNGVNEDSDSDSTPIKYGSAKKRVRSSVGGSPTKKSISRMTKGELKAELQSSKKAHAYSHVLLRDTSPLTDLDDEDEVLTTQLREELKERDEELENLRRELSAARLKRTSGGRGTESATTSRFATPETTINFDRASSPPARRPTTIPSRMYPGGVVRTESGSFIPNMSKQPTPAPTSPERDVDCNERDADADDFDMVLDAEQIYPNRHANPDLSRQIQEENLDMSLPGSSALESSNDRGNLVSRLQAERENANQELSQRDTVITLLLNSEIRDLKKRVEGDEALISGKNAEIVALEKTMADQVKAFEVLVADRNATIEALRDDNGRIQAEVAGLQESWRQAEEKVTTGSAQLQAAQNLVLALRTEGKEHESRLGLLETSNASLRGEIERRNAEYAEMEQANESLQTQVAAAVDEIASLKQVEEERKSQIDSLVESLSRTANDGQILRERTGELEKSVSMYKAEIQEKSLACENLETRIREKDAEVERLSVELQNADQSVEGLSGRLAEAQSTVASLCHDLVMARKRTETVESSLAEMAARLASEEEEKQRIADDLAEKVLEIRGYQKSEATALLTVDSLRNELSVKGGVIQRLNGELDDAQGRIRAAEESMIEAERKNEAERVAMSSQLSELLASLASAKGNIDGLNSQLLGAHADGEFLKQNLANKEAEIANLKTVLDAEREQRTMLEADLAAYVGKTQDLEEELCDLKTSKETDEVTISNLRDSFAKLRDSQLQIFGELEDTIASAQSSPAPKKTGLRTRITAPPS